MTTLTTPTEKIRCQIQPDRIIDLTGQDTLWAAQDYAQAAEDSSEDLPPNGKLWLESYSSPFAPPEKITDDLVIMTAGNYGFRSILLKQLQNAEVLGHRTVVYDLGGLGVGLSRPVENKAFHRDGRYCKLVNGWPSKGLHKPALISDCLERMLDERSVLVYLDADAVPVRPLSELTQLPFDVAVAIRPAAERKAMGFQYASELGQTNAGVLMFRPTPAAKTFMQIWTRTMEHCGGDQLALNRILPAKLVAGETRMVNGCRIKVLPSHYNVSCPGQAEGHDLVGAAIVHFKSKTWSAFGKMAHFKTLYVPDHRRRVVARTFPAMAPMNASIMSALLNQKLEPITLEGVEQLLTEGWDLKKIWVDDKCAPTFGLTKTIITASQLP